MRRLVCLFLASLFVSQDALAQGALIAGGVEVAGDFIGGPDGTAVATGLALLLLVSIVILLAMTWLIEKAFDKVFKGEEISIWPSVSTFIAYVIASVGGGILIGIEDVIQLDFDEVIKIGIPFVAILGFLPAIFVWVVKHFLRYLARRLRNLGAVPGTSARERYKGRNFPKVDIRKLTRRLAVLAVVAVASMLLYGSWHFYTNRQPPLIRAINALNVQRVYSLLERGADPNQLTIATRTDISQLDIYFWNSPPYNDENGLVWKVVRRFRLAYEPGQTALDFAWRGRATPRRYSVIHALMEYGADPSIRNLGVASWLGNVDIVEAMLARMSATSGGAVDPDSLDQPMVEAIDGGNADVVRLLLDAGADYRNTFGWALVRNRGNQTRLDPDETVVAAFLDHGADPNAVYTFDPDALGELGINPIWNGTPLILALTPGGRLRGGTGYGRPWRVEVIRLLLERGADPNLASPTGYNRPDMSPLEWAESRDPLVVGVMGAPMPDDRNEVVSLLRGDANN